MSQEQEPEPKTLREIISAHIFFVEPPESKGALEDALLAWAKAYGEQVRAYLVPCMDGTFSVDDLWECKLPEPK